MPKYCVRDHAWLPGGVTRCYRTEDRLTSGITAPISCPAFGRAAATRGDSGVLIRTPRASPRRAVQRPRCEVARSHAGRSAPTHQAARHDCQTEAHGTLRAVFTFVEGFDNLSVAIFTHGFRDRPLPVELLAMVQTTNSPLVAAVSGVQIVLAIIALILVALSIGLDKVNE